jgi:hypothetical protein
MHMAGGGMHVHPVHPPWVRPWLEVSKNLTAQKFETNLARLCLGGKQIGNGGQEMETEVQVPDGGAEDDHREKVNHHGRIVVVHRLA